MAHVREEFALGPRRRFCRLLRAAQLLVPLPPFGDVSQERSEKISVTEPRRRSNRELDWELAARSVQGGDFQTLVHHRRLAGGEKPPDPAYMCFPELVRDDHVCEVAPDRLRSRPAERRLRPRVPVDDEPG